MGVRNGQEQAAQVVTGSFTTGSQVSAAFCPAVSQTDRHPLNGKFNASVSGTFPAPGTGVAVVLKRSFDGGATYLPMTTITADNYWHTDDSRTFVECEPGVLYRFETQASFTGSVTYRISQ